MPRKNSAPPKSFAKARVASVKKESKLNEDVTTAADNPEVKLDATGTSPMPPISLDEIKVGAIPPPPPPPPAAKTPPAREINTSDPKVACVAIKSHSCSINGVKYAVAKGEDCTLPNSVATILAHAGVVIKK